MLLLPENSRDLKAAVVCPLTTPLLL